MKTFRSVLIVRSASTAEYKLAETASIHTLPMLFTISPANDYVYASNGAIEIYTTAPLNKIHTVEYKKDIKDMLLAHPDTLYILNDDSLFLHSSYGFNSCQGSFANSKLISAGSNTVGVQTPTELVLYDNKLRRAEVFRAQCSYAQRDILLLGDFNMLVVVINGTRTMEVAMPDRIVSIVSDVLFTSIFVSCQDSNVYCVSLVGEPMQAMAYHKEPVRYMKLSFCGNFLYTADTKRICTWSTADYVVHGFVDFDKPIEGIEVVLAGNRIYKDIPVQVN